MLKRSLAAWVGQSGEKKTSWVDESFIGSCDCCTESLNWTDSWEAQTRRENGVWECLGAKKRCHGKGDDKLLVTDKWENRRDGERDRKAVSGIFRSSSQEGSIKNCEWLFWILIKCDLIIQIKTYLEGPSDLTTFAVTSSESIPRSTNGVVGTNN